MGSDSDEDNGEKVKDQNFMSRQLQDWLNAGDYGKALKFTQGKMSKGQRTSMFYAVITAYCMLKAGKQQDCLDIL